eukprot:SM000044S16051  [mRNA]  locus=s44:722358:722919:- [translate_table: standard]
MAASTSLAQYVDSPSDDVSGRLDVGDKLAEAAVEHVGVADSAPGQCADTTADLEEDVAVAAVTVAAAGLAPHCKCSPQRLAVMKVTKTGPNRALRYWACTSARPLFARRPRLRDAEPTCGFFQWLDQPRTTPNERRQQLSLVRRQRELALLL